MRVYEVAREFKIDPEKLTQLLRSMGVAVRSEATAVSSAGYKAAWLTARPQASCTTRRSSC